MQHNLIDKLKDIVGDTQVLVDGDLSAYEVQELSIRKENLEDIFMKYYEKEVKK